MKKYILLLLVMLVASPAFSQKKGKKEKGATTDSLTNVIDTPSVKVDSLTTDSDTIAKKVDSLTTVTDTLAGKVDSLTAVTDTLAEKVDSVAKATTPAKTDPVAKVAATTTVVAATTTVKPDSVTAITGTSQLDSLTKVTQLLTAKFNTVNAELEKFQVMYTAVKEKVLKHDFDPARTGEIIDSLGARRDSTIFSALSVSTALRDTLSSLKKEYLQMKAQVEGFQAEEAARDRLVKELKQLKELLDVKILTQSEFDIRKTLVLERWK